MTSAFAKIQSPALRPLAAHTRLRSRSVSLTLAAPRRSSTRFGCSRPSISSTAIGAQPTHLTSTQTC